MTVLAACHLTSLSLSSFMTEPTKATTTDIIPSLAVNRNVPKGKETHNIFSSVVIYSQLNAFILMTFWNNGGPFFFLRMRQLYSITANFAGLHLALCHLLKQMDPFCTFDNKKGLFFSLYRYFREAFFQWYGFCSKCVATEPEARGEKRTEQANWAQTCYVQV